MNPDYFEKDYDRYKDRYAGPYMDDGREEAAEDRRARKHYRQCMSQVGRIITQAGLVGVLVLSYGKGSFKLRLCDGSIVDGTWSDWYFDDASSAGISSNGWTVGDAHPMENPDDIPF